MQRARYRWRRDEGAAMLVDLKSPRRGIDRRRDARQPEAEHAPGEQELALLAFRRQAGDASLFVVGQESPA